MKIEGLVKVVESLNYSIWTALDGELDDMEFFSFQSNGYVHTVTYLGYRIWNSEDNPFDTLEELRRYLDGEYFRINTLLFKHRWEPGGEE